MSSSSWDGGMAFSPFRDLSLSQTSSADPSHIEGNGTVDPDDPFELMHNHNHLICISDRVDQTLIFPFVHEPGLLEEIVDTVVDGTSVLVVGEPGIGKRTLSLAVARRLHALRKANTSHAVASRAVYTLSLGRNFATQGAGVTALQNEIRHVFRLVERAGPEKIILCIDDVDVLSFVDALVVKQRRLERPSAICDSVEPILSTENMLRFLLFSKKVLCMATCISAAYDRLVVSDTYYDEKFSKSFRVFHIPEPSIPHSLRIVMSHRERIEAELDVVIPPETMRASVSYAVTFLSHRRMPEKALDLLNEACLCAVHDVEHPSAAGSPASVTMMCGRPVVTKPYVDALILQWCGVSERRLLQAFNDGRFNPPL